MGLGNRKIIRWMITTLWIAIGAGTLVLLVAAARRKEGKKCVGVYINIHGVSNNFFVDKKDIMDSIETMVGGDPTGQTINSFDLEKIENGLTANIWVKSAQLFFDNNEKLQVNVLEREPIARIFTTVGTTFYIDSSIEMLPLSEKFSARLPVFTDFPQEKADTALLTDIKNISLAVQKDSFCMAMIDQIDITPQKTFEMVPKIGNQVIVFGDGTNIEEKLNNLQLFYKKVITKTGWNYYSSIDLQYKDQVVAKRKGAEDKTIDSLKTLQLMQAIAANAKKLSEDSSQTTVQDNNIIVDASSIQQSTERDDEGESTDTATTEQAQPQKLVPVVKPVEEKPIKEKPIEKPVEAKPKENVVSPKVKKPDAAIKKQPVTKPVAKPTAKKPEVKKETKPETAKPVKPKTVSMSPKEKAANNDY
jgi:cell division protein FtsQ